jgi:hypothetical protein
MHLTLKKEVATSYHASGRQFSSTASPLRQMDGARPANLIQRIETAIGTTGA